MTRGTPPLPPLSPNAWLRWNLVQRLLPDQARDVLEVGCGMGGFAARLVRRYGHYVSVELDQTVATLARQRVADQVAARPGATGEIIIGDLTCLAPEDRFDLVCAFEVIEHLEDDRAALAEWVHRVRPGGSLVLSTPGFPHRYTEFDEFVGHFRRYVPDELADLLTAAGLVDVRVQQFGGILGYVLEAGRNWVGRRRLAAAQQASMAERTAGSGRLLQPDSRTKALITAYGTWPFRVLDRIAPDHGPGLVAVGRKPAAAASLGS